MSNNDSKSNNNDNSIRSSSNNDSNNNNNNTGLNDFRLFNCVRLIRLICTRFINHLVTI